MPTLDAAYFAKYDDLKGKLGGVATADTDLQRSRQELANARVAKREADAKLEAAKKSLAKHEKTVDKYKDAHTALRPGTWFKGGAKGVTEKNKAMVEEDETAVQKLNSLEDELDATIKKANDKVLKLITLSEQKAAFETESESMFEAAVATAPSQQQRTLEQEAETYKVQLQFEQTNGAIMEQCDKLCTASRKHYSQSIGALQQASATNRGAQINNVIGGRNRGMEMMEHIQEQRRNMLMKQAQMHAEEGARALEQCFSMIPLAARERYPQHCIGLGNVQVPTVHTMGIASVFVQFMGGDLVDFMVNMQAQQKIRMALDKLGDAERLASSQENQIKMLLVQIQNDGTQAAAKLRACKASIRAEKEAIFNGLRAGGRLPMAMPVPTAVPVSQAMFLGPAEATSRDHAAARTMQTAVRRTRHSHSTPAGEVEGLDELFAELKISDHLGPAVTWCKETAGADSLADLVEDPQTIADFVQALDLKDVPKRRLQRRLIAQHDAKVAVGAIP